MIQRSDKEIQTLKKIELINDHESNKYTTEIENENIHLSEDNSSDNVQNKIIINDKNSGLIKESSDLIKIDENYFFQANNKRNDNRTSDSDEGVLNYLKLVDIESQNNLSKELNDRDESGIKKKENGSFKTNKHSNRHDFLNSDEHIGPDEINSINFPIHENLNTIFSDNDNINDNINDYELNQILESQNFYSQMQCMPPPLFDQLNVSHILDKQTFTPPLTEDPNFFSTLFETSEDPSLANKQLTKVDSSKCLSKLSHISDSVLINNLGLRSLAIKNENSFPNNLKVEKSFFSSKKRKDVPGSKIKPAFVMKIWSMVNDPLNKSYICWKNDGKSFQVFHREEFMKVILPKYFKHNNFASFVRQLNMYGWHKVQDINNGSLLQNKDVKNLEEIWQFENPFFIRNREDLLDKIVRNKSVSQDADSSDTNNLNLQFILNELNQIKVHQLAINDDLSRVKSDNKTLWKEICLSKEKIHQQSQTLSKVLNFLAAVYGNNTMKGLDVENHSSGFADLEQNKISSFNFSSNVVNKPQLDQKFFNKGDHFHIPRLMLTNDLQKKISVDQNSLKLQDSQNLAELMKIYNSNNENTIASTDIIKNEKHNSSFINTLNEFDQSTSQEMVYHSSQSQLTDDQIFNSSNESSRSDNDEHFYKAQNQSNINELISSIEQNVVNQNQIIENIHDSVQKCSDKNILALKSNKINNNLESDCDDNFDVNDFLSNVNQDLVVINNGHLQLKDQVKNVEHKTTLPLKRLLKKSFVIDYNDLNNNKKKQV